MDRYFTMGSRSMLVGIMLWNDLARQEQELKELETLPPPQEMVKQYRIELLFNPEAVSWISRALEIHAR